MLRILVAHNTYLERGGEDAVFADEVRLLRDHGHEVLEYTETNARIREIGALGAAARAVWSREAHRRIRSLIMEKRPHIAHFHNTFPMISPSAYYACREMRIPTLQTLHNFRLLCPAATLFRSGAPCELCLGKFLKWPAVQHACYRGSRAQSAIVATMLGAHSAAGTWRTKVDLYLAVSDFSRRLFIEAGLPTRKLLVKPNFVDDPGAGQVGGNYALFVGRLSEEKGVRLLLRAWKELPDVPLRMIGDGPLLGFARECIAEGQLNVDLVGRVSRQAVMRAMSESAFVVFPSLCYETFGRIIAEAFACGKPVVAARGGAAEELVDDGRTGFQFAWNDADDLARCVRRLWRSALELRSMSEAARQEYLLRYTPDRNYEMLMAAYAQAIESRST